MAESQELDHLTEVDEALARYAQVIDAAIDTVLDQQVTDYPILVFQREADLPLGVALLDDVNPGHWEVRITTLEELAGKNLMRAERVAGFREVYVNARQQYCLFVVTAAGASFAFRARG